MFIAIGSGQDAFDCTNRRPPLSNLGKSEVLKNNIDYIS